MKHKLAFLGPKIVHEAFKDMDDSWDMQIPLETLDDFERELNLPDESAQISKETSVIIFFSRLFGKDPERFAELVAFSAPYSVSIILIPKAELKEKIEIEKFIKRAQTLAAREDPSYNTNTPFYFAVYEDAQVEILYAIDEFCKSSYILDEIKDAVRPMLPATDGAFEDEFEDFGEYDDFEDPNQIIIPEAAPGAKGQVIAVTSSKGGSGKSTVSVGMSAYIRQASKIAYAEGKLPAPLSVCVIDLDVRDGQLGFLNGAVKPTVVDIVYQGEPTPENIKKGIFHSTKMDIDFIFAAKRPRNAKEIHPRFYAEMIQNLRSMYDIIVLDTSVNYLDPLLEEVAYPIADKIIFVSDMGISSIFGATRWINETLYSQEKEIQAVDPGKVGFVINKAMADLNMGPQKIERALQGLPVIGMIPSAPAAITYAANTNELGQILKIEHINKAFKAIVEAVIEEPLSDVPFIK